METYIMTYWVKDESIRCCHFSNVGLNDLCHCAMIHEHDVILYGTALVRWDISCEKKTNYK